MRRDGHENACFVDYPVHQLSRLFKLDKCSVNRSNFMGTYHTFPLIFKDVITGKPVRGVDYVLVMSQKRKITCDKDIVLGDYILTSEDNLEKCEKAKELFLSTRKTKLFKKELCESIDVGVYRMHPKSGH